MESLPPAARLIEHESSFMNGSCYRDWLMERCGPGDDPKFFDALGALFWAYRDQPVENRRLASKRVFHLCEARYGHTRIGQLQWEDAFSLLKDAGA